MKSVVRIIALSGVGVAIVGGVIYARNQWTASQTELAPTSKVVKPGSRSTPTPSGTFDVKIERAQLPQFPVAGLSDNHDVLLQTEGKRGEFDLYNNGKSKHITTIDPKVRVYLRPDGSTVQLAEEHITSGTTPTTFPYNESADRPRFLQDGSMIVVRKHIIGPGEPKHDPRFQGDYCTLTKETQVPKDSGAAAAPNSANKTLGAISQGYVNHVEKSQEWYATDKVLTMLNSNDKDTVWVSERQGRKPGTPEKLLKFTDGKREEVSLPQGYEQIHRVAVTGSHVVATFGTVNGKLPFRAFAFDNNAWKELPVPSGSDCSFVQQIFNDGVMLGFVTSWDGRNIKHVLWKGDAVAVLDDLQGWPKNGVVSLVSRSNRVGDIAVRNLMDADAVASEYYVLSLKY